MRRGGLHIASWVLLGLLLVPIFQQITGVVHERKLKGSYTIAPVPSLNSVGWFRGTFQDSLEDAASDRFGFHNLFIRVNNQVAFSLYRKALASGVEIGKENYLYELNYILAHQGLDYLGDSMIEATTAKLARLQQYLGEKGKTFVVVFAAGKGTFYPEYFPDKFSKTTGLNNQESYTRYFEEYGVNYIDFNQWFREMKDTSSYILYPRTGIHWSYYGMTLVADSLARYLEAVTGEDFPDIERGPVKLSRHYRETDDDIERALNIIFRVNYDKMAYPDITFHDEGVEKKKAIIIADSFYWNLFNVGYSERMFDKGEFWYYNQEVYIPGNRNAIQMQDVDQLEKLNNTDIVIIMGTEATMEKFPFGIETLCLSE